MDAIQVNIFDFSASFSESDSFLFALAFPFLLKYSKCQGKGHIKTNRAGKQLPHK